jgi:hypothetical protein
LLEISEKVENLHENSSLLYQVQVDYPFYKEGKAMTARVKKTGRNR